MIRCICVSNFNKKGEFVLPLTVGKQYDIELNDIKGYAWVINDLGSGCVVNNERFIRLDEYRNSIIDEILK